MKNKGITLVALVVTIIILLILAGITIAQLTGSGLFENTRLAKEKSDNAQAQEDETLKDYENQIGEYINSSRDTVTILKEEYEQLKKKGTWELLAENTTTTPTEYVIDNLDQYSRFVICAVSKSGVLCASTEVTIELLKQLGENEKGVSCNYNSGTPYTATFAYVDTNKVELYCRDSNTSKAILYGVY